MAEKRPKAKRPRPGKRSPRSPNRHGIVSGAASEKAQADVGVEGVPAANAEELQTAAADSEELSSGAERLQKILSRAGVTSRRKAEQLIVEGRVTVNGKTVTELGSKADLLRDHIKVDGALLHAPKHKVYLALNKPKNCVTTVSDPEGRETVMHLMRGVRERVFPVGRLDYQSEGLLLLTNDGDFAHRITAPANHVTKVYVVKANGPLTEEQERSFREGVPMHGRRTAPAEITMIKSGVNPWYEIKIAEGRQNQIRVMFQNFGRLVEKLRRVKIAFLELDVPPGRYRSLTPKEIERFRKLLKLDAS
jgi:23S rRNA pseudouridine2605 synthase